MSKKRKIRSLNTNSYASSTKRKCLKKLKFGILVISSLGIIIISFLIAIPINFKDFYINYMEQYNLLVNGKPNYCSPNNLKARQIFTDIKSEIINQEVALKKIEDIFYSKSKFLSLAVIGSSGIGKTKFSQLLRDNFWWQENVQHYIWASFETKTNNEQNIKQLIKNFKHCGENLLIIDDLLIDHYDFINQFNEKASKFILNSKNLSLTILYIFNLSRYNPIDDENFESNLKKFKNNIDNSINVVKFRTFNETDMIKCINKNSNMLNISLSSEKIDEIKKIMNVKRSGCKNIYAKVLLYKYIV